LLCNNIFSSENEIDENTFAKLQTLLNDSGSINALDFNRYIKSPYFNGSILTLFTYIAATFDDADLLLMKVLNTADLNRLKFDLTIQDGEYAGTTPLWWMAFLAANDMPKAFSALIKRREEFNFGLLTVHHFAQDGEFKDISTLCWLVLARIKHANNWQINDLLQNMLQFSGWKGTDLNHKMTTGMFKGTTPLWWLGWLAKQDEPHFLNVVLDRVAVKELDFSACADFSLELDIDLSGPYRFDPEKSTLERSLGEKREIHVQEQCQYSGVTVEGLLSEMDTRFKQLSLQDAPMFGEVDLDDDTRRQQILAYQQVYHKLKDEKLLPTNAKQAEYIYQSYTSKPKARRN